MMSAPRLATQIPARGIDRITASTVAVAARAPTPATVALRRLVTYVIPQESLSDKERWMLASAGGPVRRHPFALGLDNGLVLAGLHSATVDTSDFYNY